MAIFEPVTGGVRVLTDKGIVVGEARTFGQRISSDQALAQLGYADDGEGGLRVLTDAEKAARIADLPEPEESAEGGDQFAGLSDDELRDLVKSRGGTAAHNTSRAKLLERLA